MQLQKKYFLPKSFLGKDVKYGGVTHTTPRKWTKEEENWALKLRDLGFSNREITVYLNRTIDSVSLKMKRLRKRDGVTYNNPHREDKYLTNDLFLKSIQPKSVLDLYSGEKSYYDGKVKNLTTNDIDSSFKTDYSENAEKLVCKLYYENKKYDLIDIDPFGSPFECIDLSIKMARKGIIITFGEMGHVRWKRLDFVRSHYGINTIEELTSENIIKEVIRIGERNKKKLIPIVVKDYNLISRVWFKIEPYKITEQWNDKVDRCKKQ